MLTLGIGAGLKITWHFRGDALLEYDTP